MGGSYVRWFPEPLQQAAFWVGFVIMVVAGSASLWIWLSVWRVKRGKPELKVDWSLITWMGVIGVVLFAAITGVGLAMQRGSPVSAAQSKVPPDSDNPFLRWNQYPEIGSSMTVEGIISVTAMGQTGVSIAKQEFEFQNAFFVSAITGAKQHLFVSTQDGLLPFGQINPIPPGASVTLRAELVQTIPEQNFLRDWGMYSLVYVIDGKQFRRPVGEADVVSVFTQRRRMGDPLDRGPRVTKKK